MNIIEKLEPMYEFVPVLHIANVANEIRDKYKFDSSMDINNVYETIYLYLNENYPEYTQNKDTTTVLIEEIFLKL